MSTIKDFENAPVGATATSPDGQKVYRRETKTLMGADWVRGEGEARLRADADGLANFGYTLGPAPSPAPTTAREALELAWELAHEVKEGQAIPEGTRFLLRDEFGLLREDEILDDWEHNPPPDNIRTLDPLYPTEGQEA